MSSNVFSCTYEKFQSKSVFCLSFQTTEEKYVNNKTSQLCMAAHTQVLGLGRLRQVDCSKFKVGLSYRVSVPFQTNKQTNLVLYGCYSVACTGSSGVCVFHNSYPNILQVVEQADKMATCPPRRPSSFKYSTDLFGLMRLVRICDSLTPLSVISPSLPWCPQQS